MKFGLLLLVICFNALALECGDLPEGQVVRLDQGNGSLAQSAVQDQDGIGSCYANQASLLLQTVVPGNPNLSYLNLGLYYTNDKTLKKTRDQGNNLYTVDGKKEDGTVVPESGSAIVGGFACQTIEAALARQKSTGVGSVCKAEDVSLEHSFFNAKGNFDDSSHKQEASLTKASRYMNSYQKRFGFAFEPNQTSSRFQKQREEADKFSLALQKFVKNSSDAFFAEKCTKQDTEKMDRIVANMLTRAINAHPECLVKGRISPAAGAACKSLDQFGFVAVSSFNNSSKINFILLSEHRQKMLKSLPAMYKDKSGFDNFMNNMFGLFKQMDKSKSTPAQKEAFSKNLNAAISPEDKKALEADYERVALGQIDGCKSENILTYFQNKKEFLEKAKADTVLCNYSELLERAVELAGVLPEKAINDMSTFIDFITAKAGMKYDEALLALIAKDCSPSKRVMIPENLKCSPSRVLFEHSDVAEGSTTGKFATTVRENRAKMFSSIRESRGVGLDICTKFWKEPGYDFHRESSSTKFATCGNSGVHGFHAITMIGYRCKDNRIQYLAQNSWGPNWKLEGNPYEIENGKIWMDEDKLFRNLDNINYLSQ